MDKAFNRIVHNRGIALPETKEKERELWRNALDSCFKKKCEPGEYGLHGKCVPY